MQCRDSLVLAQRLQSVGSVVVAHGLSCSVACGILVPGPGIEPMFLALAGGFLTTGPPEKSLGLIFKCRFYFYFSIVRPTGQKMIAIETMVCYSQFPKGGGMPHYPGVTWGHSPLPALLIGSSWGGSPSRSARLPVVKASEWKDMESRLTWVWTHTAMYKPHGLKHTNLSQKTGVLIRQQAYCVVMQIRAKSLAHSRCCGKH